MLLNGVMVAATCIPTPLEKRCPLSVDVLVPEPIFVSTHAITIDAPPEHVWPWITTIVTISSCFGWLTFVDAPRLQMNMPTPWIGLWERINISVFLLWVVTQAAVLWRTGTTKAETSQISPISVRDSRAEGGGVAVGGAS